MQPSRLSQREFIARLIAGAVSGAGLCRAFGLFLLRPGLQGRLAGKLAVHGVGSQVELAVFWLVKEDAGNNIPSVIGAA